MSARQPNSEPDRSFLNVLVEAVWNNTAMVTGFRRTERENEVLINPGVRWAVNLPMGLQVVPGVAVPFGVGPSRGERGVFFYLSLNIHLRKNRTERFRRIVRKKIVAGR